MAYFGLYVVHWLAFGLVVLLYRVKVALHSRNRGMRATGAGSGGKAEKAE